MNNFSKFTHLLKNTNRNPAEKESENKKHPQKTEEYEKCVICGSLTRVPVSMPINRRENYLAGCGQLCDECAKNIRKISD